MTPEEKEQFKQMQQSVTDLTAQFHELLSNKKEVELIGAPADSMITLSDLEATVKVLNHYKSQGFKTIVL